MIQLIIKVLDFDIELSVRKICNFVVVCAKTNRKCVEIKNLKIPSEFIWHAKKEENHEKNLISKTDASNNVG